MKKQLPDNIILVGFMGSGKTTVGKHLALRLGYRFIDTDTMIEKSSGKKIAELFAISEDYFRSWEFQITKALQSNHKSIISTGGGLVTVQKTADLLKTLGSILYLKVSPDSVYERTKHSTHRPLLKTENPQETISKLLNQRDPIYESVAQRVIDCDNISVEDILNMILSDYDNA